MRVASFPKATIEAFSETIVLRPIFKVMFGGFTYYLIDPKIMILNSVGLNSLRSITNNS
jgi:hypothetical protein